MFCCNKTGEKTKNKDTELYGLVGLKSDFETDSQQEYVEKENIRRDFIKKTDLKNRRKEIERVVKSVQLSEACDLEARRKRLMNLYDNEDKCYEGELQEYLNNNIIGDFEARKQRYFQILHNQNEDRIKYADDKKKETILDDISKEAKINLQKCHLEQMKDHEREREYEKSVDNIWFEISKRVNNKMVDREKEEEKLFNYRRNTMLQSITEQISANIAAATKNKSDNRSERDKRDEIIKNEIAEENRKRQEKKDELRHTQLIMIQQSQMKKQKILDQKQEEIDQRKLDVENHNTETDILLREKIDLIEKNRKQRREFLDYVQDFERCKKCEENLENQAIQDLWNETDDKAAKIRRERKEKQREITIETNRIRLEQIRERQEKDADEKFSDSDREFLKLLRYGLEEDKKKEAQRRAKNIEYQNEILKQAECDCKRKTDARIAERIHYENMIRQENEEYELAKSMIKSGGINKSKVHPFKKVIQETGEKCYNYHKII